MHCTRRPVNRTSPAASVDPLRLFQQHFSSRTRDRGAQYAREGRVEIVDATDNWLLASVRGSRRYAVDLDCGEGAVLRASCTCPYFAGFEPCKHVWATLVAALREDALVLPQQVRTIEFDFDGVEAEDEEYDDGEPAVVIPPPPRARRAGASASTTWRDVLSATGVSAAPVAGRGPELRYVIDPDATRTGGSLVVRVLQRAGRRGASPWRSATPGEPVSSFVAPADALLVGMLQATGSSGGYYALRSDFRVRTEVARELVERLCATGRAHLKDPEGPALRWDATSYDLVLEAVPGGRGTALALHARLERGDERVAVTEPALLLAGGLAFWPDRVASFDDRGQFLWIVSERANGPARVPARELDDLVEALHRSPSAPRLRLPPDRALEEVSVDGSPYALLWTKRDGWIDGGFAVEAGVDYGGIRAPLETHGRALLDRTRRRLVLRDAEREALAREALEAAGVRPLPQWQRAGSRATFAHRVAAGRLEGAVRALVERGWRVEVDGSLRRKGGDLAIEVATGIDWLDVHVQARFDGVPAPLPELLAALRHKRRTVVLADGSTGEVPEEWVQRLQRWTAMADARDDALRFRKAQTALVAALVDREEGVAVVDEAFAKLRTELDSFRGVEPLDPPSTMRGELRDYQRYALGWFQALRRLGFGGCLADDMGLGKTVQVLAMLDARRQERPAPGPSLVVAPRSVLHNWAAEAARFTPGLRVHVHDGVDRAAPGAHFRRHDVVLTTYGLLRKDVEPLSRVAFDYVVLDEAQAIKTARSAAAVAARQLRAAHKLALTGTPLENHLGELASLIEFLEPGVLGASSALGSLAQGGRKIDDATREVLARAVRPFFLRRTKREVATELPDRVEQTIACELQGEQRRLYDELADHYRRSLARRVERDGVGRSTVHILEALLRLRQAACHAGLVDEARRGEPSAKLDVLLEHLETVRAQGQKALVFSQFTSALAIVRDRLRERGIVHEYLDGKTRDRPRCVARFQTDARCGVFLVSLKAGGLGLNLTAAEYVFLLDPWWNPAVEAQAIDRAHRIGQTRTVFAYKLIARGTVEEKVAELQQQKRELADALFGDGGAALGGLRREDLELLLS